MPFSDMKPLLFVFFLLSSAYVKAQNICVDSSSHIRYLSQLNDSLRVEKTILTKDSGKVMVGRFVKSQFPGKSFIIKIDRRGEVTWFKKITSPFASGLSEIQSIGEAENGNIFVAFNYSGGIRPFNYLVFSRDGTLVFQNCFGIANNEYASINLPQTSMITKFGPDSMLVVLIHPVNAVTLDGMTLLTISNEGKIGQAVSYAPQSYPVLTPITVSAGWKAMISSCMGVLVL